MSIIRETSNSYIEDQHLKLINDANFEFYNKIEIEKFKEFSAIIGLDEGIDIKVIYPEIKNLNTIAEIGSGYGRAIEFIKNNQFSGQVYAVERVRKLLDYMEEKYTDDDNIEIIDQDLKQLNLPNKADCILWLWSGILELSLPEQRIVLKRLKDNLGEDGFLLIETPYKNVRVIGSKGEDNYIKFETEWGTIEAYLPTFEELKESIQLSGFSSIESTFYQTKTGLTRIFYKIC
ncbi:class I SAM-dependent methyltransferase [Flexithrix dorotheae]|uniref:class I SAM-dependent methyltransferase n=1 Tax=Flexithrix dorotheae TaxID=70993 RepID=UPI00037FAB42|nr:class I SAM-dependent methyltransferase [Flexithrix dorotheae]